MHTYLEQNPPMGQVEPLNQPSAVSQPDLQRGDREGVVECHHGNRWRLSILMDGWRPGYYPGSNTIGTGQNITHLQGTVKIDGHLVVSNSITLSLMLPHDLENSIPMTLVALSRDQIKSNVFVLPFLQAISLRVLHTPIELPLSQPKPSWKTRTPRKTCEKKCKKP